MYVQVAHGRVSGAAAAVLPTGRRGRARAALVQGLVNATKSYSQVVVAFKNCSVQLHKVEI